MNEKHFLGNLLLSMLTLEGMGGQNDPPLGFLGIKNVLFNRLPKVSAQLFFD